MAKTGIVTKDLAVAGTVLVWIPIVAPVLFSAAFLIQAGKFRFDYLMPAELFPAALAGGCLLLWAALRARSRRGLIGGSLASAVVLPVAGQALASVTGLASGRTEPTGWPWALVLALLAAYGSLYPLSDWRDSGAPLLDFLGAGWPRYTTGFDMGSNVGKVMLLENDLFQPLAAGAQNGADHEVKVKGIAAKAGFMHADKGIDRR